MLEGKAINLVIGKYWCGSGRGGPDRWVVKMNRSGGQLVEQVTHTIDMMRYLVGEVEEVYAVQANRVLKEIDCPDNNSLTLKFTNGAIGSLTTSWSYDPGDWSNANVLDILYEDQLIHWDPAKVQVKEDGAFVDKTAPGPSIDAVFVDAVRSGDGSKILSPYSDAVKSLAISLVANQSGQKNAPVQV